MQSRYVAGFGLCLVLLLALGACQLQKSQSITLPIQNSGPVVYTATPTHTATLAFMATYTKTPTLIPTFSSTITASSTPTVAATSTATPTLTDFNLSSAVTTLASGIYNFNCVHLGAGAIVSIAGGVTIMTQCFTLDAGATMTGLGRGYSDSFGPGGAIYQETFDTWYPCGGGGHGGAGGTDYEHNCVLSLGGVANDDAVHPVEMGSGGADPRGYKYNSGPYYYSCGGGLLELIVYNPSGDTLLPATINGTIDMSGSEGCGLCGQDQESGGGGAGGTILIEASAINGTGVLTANGGQAGSTSGAGGGGGILSLIENLTTFGGNLSVAAGISRSNDTNGCIPPSNIAFPGKVTFTTAPASGY